MNQNSALRRSLILFILAAVIFSGLYPARAQQKAKLRPLRIALPGNTIAATHFYVAGAARVSLCAQIAAEDYPCEEAQRRRQRRWDRLQASGSSSFRRISEKTQSG